jgi:hypothetical protein
VDSAVGLASNVLYIFVIITSVVTPIMVNSFGAIGCFSLFGCTTFVGVIFIGLVVKDTTYGTKDGKRVFLTEK